MSSASTWHCQYSIDVDVPVSFAWTYMTDIRNWNDPPAEFALEGPFIEGTRGITRMPGRPPALWTIRDLEPGRAYTIEGGSFLERAALLVYWRFDPLTERSARLTQRMELLGENAAAYVDDIKSSRTWSPGCEGSRSRWNDVTSKPARHAKEIAKDSGDRQRSRTDDSIKDARQMETATNSGFQRPPDTAQFPAQSQTQVADLRIVGDFFDAVR